MVLRGFGPEEVPVAVELRGSQCKDVREVFAFPSRAGYAEAFLDEVFAGAFDGAPCGPSGGAVARILHSVPSRFQVGNLTPEPFALFAAPAPVLCRQVVEKVVHGALPQQSRPTKS